MKTCDPIPSFTSPPLNEVFLGVQFDAIESFNIATYGSLWNHFKEHFPNVEHHLPIEPKHEKFGGRKQSLGNLPSFNIEQLRSAPMPRAWFLSKDSQELVQIQPDRFIRNWRKLNSSNEYPRYEQHMRAEFIKNLTTFETFLENNALGRLCPSQCEVSYINHIDVDKAHGKLDEVFVGWSNKYNASDIEGINITVKHIIRGNNNEFLGRLHVKIQPAFTVPDDRPIYLLELTARGRPLGEDIKGIMSFMDLGREKIVRAFSEMTTPEMHAIWKREV